MKKVSMMALVVGVSLSASVFAQTARDYISIVGSSTVYPFSTVVAERFGKTSGFKTPKVEATGSGGGLKLFCDGVGVSFPDVTNASRRIKQSEVELCALHGVTDIVEVKIGYDGIVLANTRDTAQMSLSLRDVWLALAAEIPNPDGSQSWVANPYDTWQQVNAALPDTKIEVLGPPPTSGTRDAFVELAMEGGCKTFDWIKALKKSDKLAYKAYCHTVREDGAFIEAGENDNLIVQKLQANSLAVGIFGFSFLDQNLDALQGSVVEGVEPEFDSIADGDYPISRPLYFYVKKAHIGVIPGLREFLAEFTSNKAFGEDGYLSDKGLIPMREAERQSFQTAVRDLLPLNLVAN